MTAEIKKRSSFSEYQAHKGINAGAICDGSKSMMHMRHHVTREHTPPTPAMKKGSLLHAAILTPDVYQEKLVVCEAKSKAVKAWKECVAGNDPEWVVLPHESEAIDSVVDAVVASKNAMFVLDDIHSEVSIYWSDPLYGDAKARLDGYRKATIAEVKTTGDVRPWAFSGVSARLQYHVRLGWYCEAVRHLEDTDNNPVVHIVCIEQDDPHDIVVYRLPDSLLEQGRKQAREVAALYHACEVSNCYAGVEDEIVELELPAWATHEEPLELTMGDEKIEV